MYERGKFMDLNYINLKYKPSKTDLIAEYLTEPNNCSIEEAAENIAKESSIGTWTELSTINKNIAKRLKPNVFYINKKQNLIKIAYPYELFEFGNMPQILSSIGGNIFGMKIIKTLRLEDIQFPKIMMNHFKGPKFGIKGIRKITKTKKRPLIGTIIKPKLGLNAKEHAQCAFNAWVGGIDIVKDDENLTSMTFNNFEKRITETIKLKEKAEKMTGEKKIYMPNITAETETMKKRLKYVYDSGNEYIMMDILTAGMSGLQTVRSIIEDYPLVIHAHRAGHAALTRNSKHGISMLSIAKIARLIGVDQLHIGTADVGKMEGSDFETQEIEDEIEQKIIRKKGHILEQDWHNIKPVFAVASGGLHPGGLPLIIKRLGYNIVCQMGGGVHGHPNGTLAGAKAARQALEAVMKGKKLEDYAQNHIELMLAIKKWGIKE
ncbi:MAG: type III ribulose-bisphosphate carboxylase [Candidatus Woesearchaeota archaeon]